MEYPRAFSVLLIPSAVTTTSWRLDSPTNVTGSVDWLLTEISCVWKLAAVTTSVEPLGAEMVKLPFWSADTASDVPFTVIVAKGTGSPWTFLICPVNLTACDHAATVNSSDKVNKQ
jgi:hypothetical protein